MWLITLIILAIVAFFIVKYMKSQSQRKTAEHERLGQSTGIEGTLDHHRADPVNSPSGVASHSASQSTGAGATAGSVAAAAGASAATAVAAGVASAANGAGLALNSGNVLEDVQEMIKILNLAEPDARRLSITPEQLRALRNADSQGMPDAQALDVVASRLRKMLA